MAPELLRWEEYGPAVDLYSFAMLAFEVCEGHAPHKGMAIGSGLPGGLTRKEFALKVAEDWRQLIVLSKAKVPAEILSQRRLVKVEITFRGLRAEFELPLFLAQRHLKRDQQAWTAIASHVVTDGALKHRIVQEHRVGTQDAFIVQAEFSARVPRVRITETPAGELRKQFVSQVPVADFCKNLRAELRFVPLNQLLPKKVEFRPAAKSGGAR